MSGIQRAQSIACLIILILAAPSFAAERDYQTVWCNEQGGIIEYRLHDNSRVDCLTDTHAVEFDFAKKVYEAVGQSLYYAAETGKRPGIVLIVEKERDLQHLRRLVILCLKHDIDFWLMFPKDLR